jgi:FAD/FMN-containing dehydrogenase
MADFLWPPGLHGYWKSSYLSNFSDEAIDVIADAFARVPSRHTVVVLEYYGNSFMQRVPESATAFGHRSWQYNIVVTSAWSDPEDARKNIAWTRELFDTLAPFTANAAYVNYIGDDGAKGLTAAYSAEKLARLTDIKTKYDPTNLFRMNQNIAPRPAA